MFGNLNPLEVRQDKGNLWENFMIAERLKYNAYNGSLVKGYFWRIVQQQEIDYVEEEAGKITLLRFIKKYLMELVKISS